MPFINGGVCTARHQYLDEGQSVKFEVNRRGTGVDASGMLPPVFASRRSILSTYDTIPRIGLTSGARFWHIFPAEI
jgi:hypothetical protein